MNKKLQVNCHYCKHKEADYHCPCFHEGFETASCEECLNEREKIQELEGKLNLIKTVGVEIYNKLTEKEKMILVETEWHLKYKKNMDINSIYEYLTSYYEQNNKP